MKKVTKFVCEFCNKVYDSKEEALKCESRGKETPLAVEGDKIKYLNEWINNFGEEDWETLILYKVEDKGHYVSYELGRKYNNLEKYIPERTVQGNEKFLKLCRKIDK